MGDEGSDGDLPPAETLDRAAPAGQLLTEAHERAVRALLEVSRHAEASSGDIEGFFGRLSRTVAELTGAGMAAFWMLDEGGDTISVQRHAHGFDEALLQLMQRTPCRRDGDGVGRRVVFEGQVLRIPRGRPPSGLRDAAAGAATAGITDTITVPWCSGDCPLGALAVYNSVRPEGFTEEDTWVLRIAAHAASLVWQHHRAVIREHAALEEERSRVHALTLVHEAARALVSTLDPDEIVRHVIRHAARLRPEPHRDIFASMLVVEGDEVVVVAVDDDHPQASQLRGARYPLQRTPLESLVRTRTAGTWQIDELTTIGGPDARRLDLRYGALAPLQRGAEVVGFLSVAGREGEVFTGTELTTLESIAHLAGLALAHAATVARLEKLAATDPLTLLPNRRHFEHLLQRRHEEGFGVLAIDVDNLKEVNDAHGHEAGDELLTAVARALRAALRDGDVVARTGGDEFCALLEDANAAIAAEVAERMRATVHEIDLPYGPARVSVGCTSGAAGDDALAVWAAADRALYAAKRAGRDRVQSAPADDVLEAPG